MPHQPEDPFEKIQRDVERMFHSLVYYRHPASHFAEPTWAPPADLLVSETSARVILELAGVPRENVQVRLRGRLLEISGSREAPRDPQVRASYHRAEIFFGPFRRAVELPWDAAPESVEAHYRDGMLEINLRRAHTVVPTDIGIERQSL